MNSKTTKIRSKGLDSHANLFIAELTAEGYARGSLSTKRAALRRFLLWRQRRKPLDCEPDEAEVNRFLSRSCRLAPKHRCLASTALFGFLEYLCRQGVIEASVSDIPETANKVLEKRYADFLRKDKGLAESSVRVYTKRHHKFLFVEIQWLGLLVTAECLGSILWRLKVTTTNQSTRLR